MFDFIMHEMMTNKFDIIIFQKNTSNTKLQKLLTNICINTDKNKQNLKFHYTKSDIELVTQSCLQ